jgi:DNA-binding MarR family transcriptional regulator
MVKVPVRKEDHVEPAVADFVDELRRVSRSLLSYLVTQAHLSNLGLIEYLVLARACDENGVTARDAARAFDLNTSTMTGISDRLEKDKLVRRHPHPTDRRVLVLKATRRGQGIIARTAGPLRADLAELASALDPEQREALTTTLRQISDRIGRDL